MRANQVKEALRATPLFEQLEDSALERISVRAVRRSYRKGEFIFRQGDDAASLFVVVSGTVKVHVTSEDGDSVVLATLQTPDVFGELSLMDEGPRSASAEAVGSVELLEVGRGPFFELLEEDPSIMRDLLKGLAAVLRRITRQTADLTFLDLPARVAKFLALSLPKGHGDEPVELDIELSQSDIAALVGGSRQSVNQALKGLERRGYITMTGRTIIVEDPAGLRRRAGL